MYTYSFKSRRVALFLFLLCILLSFGCDRKTARETGRSQTLLNEGERLIDQRRFLEAEEEIERALDKLGALIKSSPKNPDLYLIRARAYFLKFMAKNTSIIEGAAPRSKSLIKLPAPSAYRDYQGTAAKALQDLSHVLNENLPLSSSQEGILFSSLAAIYRLRDDKIAKADQAYIQATKAYESWLEEEHSLSTKIKPRTIAIAQLKNQLRDLKSSHVELYLLDEQWDKALQLLKSTMGNDDLKYFSTQFDSYLGNIRRLEEEIALQKTLRNESREEKLKKKIQKARKRRNLTPLEELAVSEPFKAELLQTRLHLADAQNNLIYRIICYHHLKQEFRLKESNNILKKFFPNIESEVTYSLKTYK